MFLTYSQCSTTKETCLERILDKFKRLKWAVVSHEKHKDDGDHLHVLIKHAKQFNVTSESYFDCLADTHPNISKAVPAWKVMEYVIKDGDFLAHGVDPVEFVALGKAKKNTSFAVIAKRVRDGDSLMDIDETAPGFVLQHMSKLNEYISFQRGAKRRKIDLEKIWMRPYRKDASVHNKILVDWLKLNVKKPRKLGQKNLWIMSETGMGKSRLKEQLMSMLRVYEAPYDSHWWDDYEDDRYDLIIFDEYRSQYPITIMNRILGSETTPLCRRGVAPVMKYDKLPVIVLSNYLPEQCYRKLNETTYGAVSVRALNRRVDVVVFPTRIDLYFVSWDSSQTDDEMLDIDGILNDSL